MDRKIQRQTLNEINYFCMIPVTFLQNKSSSSSLYLHLLISVELLRCNLAQVKLDCQSFQRPTFGKIYLSIEVILIELQTVSTKMIKVLLIWQYHAILHPRDISDSFLPVCLCCLANLSMSYLFDQGGPLSFCDSFLARDH